MAPTFSRALRSFGSRSPSVHSLGLCIGTWSTAEESQAAKYLKKPGDIKYQDVNQDGVINDKDRVIIGKGIPDGFGTLLNSFRYRNFDLTVDLQFMYGNKVLFSSQHSAEDRQGIANSFKTVLNAWTPENQNTPIAQFGQYRRGTTPTTIPTGFRTVRLCGAETCCLPTDSPQRLPKDCSEPATAVSSVRTFS